MPRNVSDLLTGKNILNKRREIVIPFLFCVCLLIYRKPSGILKMVFYRFVSVDLKRVFCITR